MNSWNYVAAALLALGLPGCAGSFDNLLNNVDKTLSMEPKTVRQGVARSRAMYCLDRAKFDNDSAKVETGFDIAMVVTGAAATGVGTTAGALSAAVNNENAKQDWGVASATLVASGAAVLLLRTALNLSDSARTKRIAAARRANAATRIAELAHDEDSVKQQVIFDECRAEDEATAAASPGSNGSGNGQPPKQTPSEKNKVEAEEKARSAKQELELARANLAAEEATKKLLEAEVAQLQQQRDRMQQEARGKASTAEQREKLEAALRDRRAALDQQKKRAEDMKQRLSQAEKASQQVEQQLKNAIQAVEKDKTSPKAE